MIKSDKESTLEYNVISIMSVFMIVIYIWHVMIDINYQKGIVSKYQSSFINT